MNMFLAFIVAFVAITGSSAMNVPDQAESVRRVRAGSDVQVEARGVNNFVGECVDHVTRLRFDGCDHAGSAQCVFPGRDLCGWGKKRQMYINCDRGQRTRTCDTKCYKPCNGITPKCSDVDLRFCTQVSKTPCTSKCGYGLITVNYVCGTRPLTCDEPCCCKRCEGEGNTPPVHPCTKDIEVSVTQRNSCCPWTVY